MGRAITFDTLAYVKKLIAAGMPEKQAEVQAETLAEIIDDKIATKQDLKELENRLQVEIYLIKSDIIKCVAGMLVAQSVVISALVKLL